MTGLMSFRTSNGITFLGVKKWVPLLLLCIILASIERYLWVILNGPTGDLQWYLDVNRAVQFTYLGFDKRHVSILLDQFSTYNVKLLVAASISGIMFSLAVFASNKNNGYRSVTFGFVLLICLLLLNKYFIQLDMHLWRQQLAFYGFVVSINQEGRIMKAIFAGIAVFFHEVAILLFALYLFSIFLNYSIKSTVYWMLFLSAGNVFLFFAAIIAGYFQVSVICIFCQVIFLANKFNPDVRIACALITALSASALFVVALSGNLGIGPVSAERLVFLSVMAGLFIFFVTNSSSKTYARQVERFKYNNDTKLFGVGSLMFLKIGFVIYYAFI